VTPSFPADRRRRSIGGSISTSFLAEPRRTVSRRCVQATLRRVTAFLPIRLAAARTAPTGTLSRVWAAAQAHCVNMSFSQTSPLVVLPEWRLPPVMLFPGAIPAHDAR